jgi:ATP-dependent DNA ligase
MGKRSRDWLKINTRLTHRKHLSVYSPSRGEQERILTQLVLGVYKGDGLVCIGHAGGGFGETLLKEIHEKLNPLEEGKFNETTLFFKAS